MNIVNSLSNSLIELAGVGGAEPAGGGERHLAVSQAGGQAQPAQVPDPSPLRGPLASSQQVGVFFLEP